MTYDPQLAIDCAYASLAAYDDKPIIPNYTTLKTYEWRGTEASLFDCPTHKLLAFRGTETLSDWFTDFNYVKTDWEVGRAHMGFVKAFKQIQPFIGRDIGPGDEKPLIITGHSLGGALATLASHIWKAESIYTFGCPRVGNKDFKVDTPLFRHETHLDPVTFVPPRQSFRQSAYALLNFRLPTLYRHVGTHVSVGSFGHSMTNYLEAVLRRAL